MRVALDTNALFTTQAGVARYIRCLLGALRELPAPALELETFAWEVENFGYRQPARTIKTVYRELLWPQLQASRLLRRRQPDVLHTTGMVFVTPPAGVKHVATLYDMALIRQPDRFRRWQRWRGNHYYSRIKEVDRIITISRFTADEAIALLGVDPARIEVTYPGGLAAPPAERPQALDGLDVPESFFLFVGSLEPGKNLELLRMAYALAAERSITLPPLLIVGARWEGVPREGTPIENWQYLGRIDDNVLHELYRRARALLFPSKYEGFGLPVLEAQELDCPVICSPVASLTEVAGTGAHLAPQTPAAYLEGMLRILNEDSFREDLIAAGRLNAQRFSWAKCARETMAVYSSAMAGDGPASG